MTALNFPSNPNDGDIFDNFEYSSSTNSWNPRPPESLSELTNVNISGTPADNSMLEYTPEKGWYSSAGLYFPVGAVSVFAGGTPPTGFLLCDGAEVSKTTYAKLFAIIGTTYNTGTESVTNFRLPNIVGRVPVGKDSNRSGLDYLGRVGGSKTHTLTIDEMAEHNHVQDAHTHNQDSHSHTQDSHQHGMSIWFNPNDWENGSFGLGWFGSYTNSIAVTGGWDIGTSSTAPYIQNTTATNNANTATNQNAGSGSAHNNLQPYIVTNYIIRYQ